MAALSLERLDAGIAIWHDRGCPDDFHNARYTRLEPYRQEGLSTLWGPCIRVLSGWKALRPSSKHEIRARGARIMDRLSYSYNQVRLIAERGDFTTCSWPDLDDLFTRAADVKGVRSPVFASKLCHLLFPRLFPVIDRAVIGIPAEGYRGYWLRCRQAWIDSLERECLIARLGAEIGESVLPSYPWATKITELCSIGARVSGR